LEAELNPPGRNEKTAPVAAVGSEKTNHAPAALAVTNAPPVRTNAVAKATAVAPAITVSPPASPRYKYLSPAKPSVGDRAGANIYFEQGIAAQDGKRLREAVEAYRRATLVDPSFFEAQYNLGRAAYDLQDLPTSLAAYENALSIASGSVNARYNFALALQKAGYAQDAVAELNKILAQNPGETRAHLSLGILFSQKLNDVAKARFHFTKVLELEPQHAQAAVIRNWLATNR
jgi:tetratricopeptide (TPR) repeat protein